MSGNMKFCQQLLLRIATGRNNEVKAMLSEDLVEASDSWGTLLHHAVLSKNTAIIPHLIEMGFDVDFINSSGITPLMLAVYMSNVTMVDALLKAGADIDIANCKGESALQIVFDPSYSHCGVIQIFIDEMRTNGMTNEQLVKKLCAFESSLYHAAYSRNIEVLKCMLNRGFDVDSRGPNKKTALHAAVELDDLKLVKWLVDNGANVNATNDFRKNPLYYAASNGSAEIVQFLLEQGANPNIQNWSLSAPLFVTFRCSSVASTEDQYDECTECLLQYGAIPYNPTAYNSTMFDYGLHHSNDKRLRLLTAHLAMLEMLGNSIADYVMYCKREKNQSKMHDYEKYYDLCLQTLTITMFDKLSLLDLLNVSESKMKLLVRNEIFTSKVKDVCSKHELNKLYPYYDNTLMKRISKAKQLVELEEAAIAVISKMLRSNVARHYYIARNVVCYLGKYELEQLCQVYE